MSNITFDYWANVAVKELHSFLRFHILNMDILCLLAFSYCSFDIDSAGLSIKDLTIVSFVRREVGVVIKNLDITSGEVTVSLNEKLLSKSKRSSDAISHSDKVIESTVDSVAAKNPQNKKGLGALSKYIALFPEKVCQFR